MAAMYSRLSTKKVKHKRMLIAQGTWSDIMEIEERIMQVLIMYSQQQRAGTDGGSASICDYLHQEWFDWVRAAKKRNTDGVAEGSWAGCERQEGLVERTPFHSFGGSQEGWAELRRVFQELIKASGHGKALELASQLPEEGNQQIKRVTEPKEAWRRLDERYGNKDLAMLSTMYRLISLELPQGPVHDKMQTLASELRVAKSSLIAVGAEGKLYASCLTIGMLINKLDNSTRTRRLL